MRINTGSIIQSIDAERKKVEKVMVSALNKTALWLKAQAAKSLFIIFSEAKQRKQERPFAG